MKLEHIALTVNHENEIRDFYQDVLGMEPARTFTLNAELAFSIFGADHEVPVFLLEKEGLVLEVFVSANEIPHGFNHICISVPERELFVQNAVDRNYDVTRIERDHGDLVFLSDKSGNVFEIKS